MKTLELNQHGLAELGVLEMMDVQGGGWREWALQYFAEKSIEWLWDNRQQIQAQYHEIINHESYSTPIA